MVPENEDSELEGEVKSDEIVSSLDEVSLQPESKPESISISTRRLEAIVSSQF